MSDYVRVTFKTPLLKERQCVHLAPKYIKALHFIAGEDRNAWLNETTKHYIEKNGDSGLSAFVRTKIIDALIDSFENESKHSNTIEGFNSTHTAFDVLTDYAFGGDSDSALEYLKTL